MKNYSRVRLTTNKYRNDGLHEGAIGYIVKTYEDANYEVEFSAADGTTLALHVLNQTEIEPAEIISEREDVVVLEPDVKKYFPDSAAVNRVLRSLIPPYETLKGKSKFDRARLHFYQHFSEHLPNPCTLPFTHEIRSATLRPMIDLSTISYPILDRPEIGMFMFHPRKEMGMSQAEGAQDVMIPVEADVSIGGRFHMASAESPNLLFFHGNGEIVADYDSLADIYHRLGVNFLPVDYRGYGLSGGRPAATAMMRDAHVIFFFVKEWLESNGYAGPLVVMGRSMGSASALELARHYPTEMDAVIIESGFAFTAPLLALLGINVQGLEISEDDGFNNLEKIKGYAGPTLIIHAEFDHIIPYSDGAALFQACPSEEKHLVRIPGANHNDIFFRGLSEYMAGVKALLAKLPAS